MGSLPLRVSVTSEVAGSPLAGGEKRSGDLRVTLTVENATVATAKSFTADPDPVDLGIVLGRIRSAIERNVYAEGLNIRIRSAMTPTEVRVAAPLRVDGTLTFARGRRRSAELAAESSTSQAFWTYGARASDSSCTGGRRTRRLPSSSST